MKKEWLIALYKSNEVKRLESNLFNQNFDYYLPKIITKKVNSNSKEEVLFPGYIFVNIYLENYTALKYTIGIKRIIKFGENVPCIADEEIAGIKMIEKSSRLNPIIKNIKIGQEAIINDGSLKGNIVEICSLPYKKRVDVLITFLGSMRRVTVLEKDLLFK